MAITLHIQGDRSVSADNRAGQNLAAFLDSMNVDFEGFDVLVNGQSRSPGTYTLAENDRVTLAKRVAGGRV